MDYLTQNCDEFKEEMDELKLKSERDALKSERDQLREDRHRFKTERDQVIVVYGELRERHQLEVDLAEEYFDAKERLEDTLRSHLREHNALLNLHAPYDFANNERAPQSQARQHRPAGGLQDWLPFLACRGGRASQAAWQVSLRAERCSACSCSSCASYPPKGYSSKSSRAILKMHL